MTTTKISEATKKIICESIEDVLRKNTGSINMRWLWVRRKTYITKECPELAEHYKKCGKDRNYEKAFLKEFQNAIFEWQHKHSSKVGYKLIRKGNSTQHHFWYGGETKMPPPAMVVVDGKKGDGDGDGNGNGEKKFYIPFAEWLEKQKECTKAVSTGYKVRGTRWSSPDVVGIKKSPGLGGTTNYELTSVEIKTSVNTGELIVGFGQACAYKLFSHKSYLVVPADSDEDALQRLKELCEQHDIGLVVFDRQHPDNPAFTLRCSAKLRGKPNPSYVNDTIKELLKKDGYDIF